MFSFTNMVFSYCVLRQHIFKSKMRRLIDIQEDKFIV